MREILSPAGNIESFYSSINNGANAVYLGLNKFNARAYATNFNLENLSSLIEYAHLRNVKIYVTLNTILYDFELKECFEFIDELVKLKVDAIIIQDLAVLHYLTQYVSSTEPHVSTQMGIDDLEGSKILKKLGATRIVYARETPLKTLKNIKNNLDIEIETFIHGALCVSYSGNCLMSSMIGERSGNRGRCAGSCRQPYTLIDNTNNKIINKSYLLSMKDLNSSKNISEMDFIDSLKIEGRMKDPEYVGLVTKFYRDLVDNKKVDSTLLDKVFNRTYTKGYLNNEDPKNIVNNQRPNNFGYEIGNIVKFHNNKIWIRLKDTLNKGDQIRIESDNLLKEISLPVTKIFDANFKECLSTNKIAVIECKENVKINAKVYKTKDIEIYKNFEKENINKHEFKKLPLNISFKAFKGKPAVLNINFDNFNVEILSSTNIEEAKTVGITKENISKSLNKLGDTPYFAENIEIILDENIFISLKELNEMRRNAISKLNELRLEGKDIIFTPKFIQPKKYSLSEKPTINFQVSNKKQYDYLINKGYTNVFFDNVVRKNHVTYKNIESNDVIVGGFGPLNYYLNKGKTIIADSTFNITNSVSVALLSSLGVNKITLSHEISKENISKLISNYKENYHTDPYLELIIYGRVSLMHTRYCPLKALDMCGKCKENSYSLKDKFASFPLKFNDDCTINILNSKVLNIVNEAIKLNGISSYRVVFTTETIDEIEKILTNLNNKFVNNIEFPFNNLTDTRGHFLKNPL